MTGGFAAICKGGGATKVGPGLQHSAPAGRPTMGSVRPRRSAAMREPKGRRAAIHGALRRRGSGRKWRAVVLKRLSGG
jgi:hypothetical protein